jgi:HEXXH motif-containing protein
MSQQTNAPAGPRHHSLSADQFTALARGGGDPDTIAQLVEAQRSKHMILVSKVAELARSGQRPDDALGVTGYQLLAQVQRQDPAAAAEVISYPSVGAWALRVIWGDTPGPDDYPAPPSTRPSGLAAIAAAAAIKAGVEAEIEVPVLGAGALLPSLGAAEAVGGTAVVSTGLSGTGRSSTREAEVRSGTRHERRRVRVGPGNPGWRELRRAEAGSLTVLIDDLDPFGMPAPDGEPTGRLTAAQAAEFRAMLRAAWPILSPARAAQSAAIVRVIVPYRASELGHISITSSQVFGTVAMSRQPGAYTCAETLVHETQHLKLYALLDLVALTRPDDGQRYYAPWRRDPRPASGLLQGAYAFMGVSGFWREQRHTAPEPEIRHRGHVEFARWRENAAAVADTLLRSGQLTNAGVTFVETMAEVLGEWRREPVPGDALARARRDSDRHLDQWQADNGQVPRSHAG